QVASALDLKIKIEAGLGEYIESRRAHGSPELLSRSQVNHQFSCIDQQYDGLVFPQYPETAQKLRQRSQRTMQALLQNYEGALLLIGHAATIRELALSLAPHAIHRDSPLCGLTELVCHHDRWTIKIQRDSSHIGHPPLRIVDFLKYRSHRLFSCDL
ncbi:MAG: histidine phosphatase family protein, partial [Cyanobacteria bacterium P01_A01_bin.17]